MRLERSIRESAEGILVQSVPVRIDQSETYPEVTSLELAALAMAGGAFAWLEDEPDIYDDCSGEEIN